MSVISMAVLRPASSSASDELRATLERQRSAFLETAPPSLEERRTDLAKLGTAMRESAPRLAEAISADFGNRSRHETMLAEVFTTLAGIRHASRHLAQWMKPKRVSVSLELMPARARILYQPLGVVGIISPWNYPFQLAMMPLLAALAAGNRVMLKPSELTPRTGEFMAELLAGLFPSEKVATVLGGADIGAAFSRLPFDHLFYTGSTAVGRLVMQAAAENLTPVTLELGGKSPVIVAEDADVDVAAKRIAWIKLLNAGQTCVAPDYVLADAKIRDELVQKIEQAITTFRSQEKSGLRIVNQRQFDRLTGYLARTKGKIALGGNSDASGLRLEPTVVVDPDPDEPLMSNEIFGPILPVITVQSLDEAIRFVNSRPKPLSAYLFTKTRAVRERVIKEVPAGGMLVNHLAFQVSTVKLPFGGVGASGMGAYHGRWGFDEFSHRKSVLTKPTRPDLSSFVYPPYTDRAWKLARRLF